MTRRTALPSIDHVQIAIAEISKAVGKPPTVLALARHLGLANTTFRRHFPDITAELHQQRSKTSTAAHGSDHAAVSRFEWITRDNADLRRSNHDLAEHLDLAVANIQRLTLDNHRLRQQLEVTANVTVIDTRHRPGPQSGHAP